MSRTIHAHLTSDDRAERRARRQPPTTRRQGTRAAVVAASLDDYGLVYPTWQPERIMER